MIAFIDNKDSFVWNIVEYISIIDENVRVFSNETSVRELKKIDPDAIIISPGPGTPYRKRDIGNSIEIIREFDLPILGICLGHQAIGVAFGGKVEKIEPRHGKKTLVHHDGKRAFEGIENPFLGGRYHSLAVTEVPESFEVSATSNDGCKSEICKCSNEVWHVKMEHFHGDESKIRLHPKNPLDFCGLENRRFSNVVMGMRHRKKDIEGFQFHPESILTESGFDILKNWYEFYVK